MRRGAVAWLMVIAGMASAGVVAMATADEDPGRTQVVAEDDASDAGDGPTDTTGDVAGGVGTDTTDAPGPTTPPVPVEGRVLLVGGSTAAAFNWNPTTQRALLGFELTMDAESCRRLYNPSCAALRATAPATAVEVIQAKGAGHHTMVLFGGYNDSGANFREGFQKTIEAARAAGIVRTLWLDYHDDSDASIPEDPDTATNYRGNNAILDELLASGDYPDVVVGRWSNYSRGQRHWFTDTVHFTGQGSWAAADYISRKVAFLDQRACPMPRQPGEAPQDPCPDPDVRPPDVDFPAVYGYDPGTLWCYRASDPDHIECRPKKTVLESGVQLVTDTLEIGDTGKQVEMVQFKLRDVGLYESYPSGKFEGYTAMAIMKFQKSKGLLVTGTANPQTREALGLMCPGVKRSKDGSCPTGKVRIVFPWEMGPGDEGIRVYVIQRELKTAKVYEGELTSQYDEATEAAVKQFQKLKRLPQTGVFDARTAKKLGFIVPDESDSTDSAPDTTN